MIFFPLRFWLWCAFYNKPLKKHIILLSKCTSRLADKRIHIKLVSSDWSGVASHLTGNVRWDCVGFSATNLALITKILQAYLLFYIWTWYIYEIKTHIKYWNEIITDNAIEKLRRVKLHSHDGQWRGRGCNAYALIAVNAPIRNCIVKGLWYKPLYSKIQRPIFFDFFMQGDHVDHIAHDTHTPLSCLWGTSVSVLTIGDIPSL